MKYLQEVREGDDTPLSECGLSTRLCRTFGWHTAACHARKPLLSDVVGKALWDPSDTDRPLRLGRLGIRDLMAMVNAKGYALASPGDDRRLSVLSISTNTKKMLERVGCVYVDHVVETKRDEIEERLMRYFKRAQVEAALSELNFLLHGVGLDYLQEPE